MTIGKSLGYQLFGQVRVQLYLPFHSQLCDRLRTRLSQLRDAVVMP